MELLHTAWICNSNYRAFTDLDRRFNPTSEEAFQGGVGVIHASSSPPPVVHEDEGHWHRLSIPLNGSNGESRGATSK